MMKLMIMRMRRDGRRRCRLPAALLTLFLLHHQQVCGLNAQPANDDHLSLEIILELISMHDFQMNMHLEKNVGHCTEQHVVQHENTADSYSTTTTTYVVEDTILFPLDYKVETDVLPDIEDKICSTRMSFHLLKNNLKHLCKNLHKWHPLQKYINDIVHEMSILDKLVDKGITWSYSKVKISPLELINTTKSVSETFKSDLTFQHNLKSCIFLRPTEKPTVPGNKPISSPTSTYSDQTTNTSTHLNTRHETAAPRGLNQSVTIGTVDHLHNTSPTYIAMDDVQETTESGLNLTATSSVTGEPIPIITSSAVSHTERATPSVETNSTASDASNLTVLISLATVTPTDNTQLNLVSTTASRYTDFTKTGTGGGTAVALSKVTSDSYLLPSTSPDKQVNSTSAPKSKILPELMGNFSGASQHDNGSSSRRESQHMQSNARPSKTMLSKPTPSTSQTSRGMATAHQIKRPGAVLPTLANGSKLPPSYGSHNPAQHQAGTEASSNHGRQRRRLQVKLFNTELKRRFQRRY